MKKFFFLILLQLAFLSVNSFGQTKEQSPLYLTNYTFSDKQPEVGQVKLRAGNGSQIKAITLSGPQAGIFKISKDNKLTIRKEKLQPGQNWADVVVSAKTTNGNVSANFRVVKDAFIRNKVVAHRGAWKNTGAAENSVAALNQAVALGCEGSEFDVRMSADSVLFINHDPDIQGLSVAKSTSDQLKSVKLSSGENLPTLEDYLVAGMKQNKTKLVLEIKASELGKENSLAATRKIVALVEKLQASAWVDYISFDYEVCQELMKLAPYAHVAYLNGDKSPAELAQAKFYGLDYHFSVLQKNPDWIKQAQQNKLTINVWTVNDKAVMENLLKENVDFITTNEPEMLLNLISVK
ncbi:glycerophosphodiester phosphodiesterase [Adhaeribacter swui]|uniref:Glycerophosphodiester phosphodiesterase n=1 Tax=Adhaeribacter swui TaxID=2086471 RepID=A0A7G7GER9_9BACT|nr:glycerophosphodiester phosphodiesterase family protein [Adhaeribacter swui]QNF35653.1 glycerophosphodiester phosphodiesterase [Adhaeribacter swui]